MSFNLEENKDRQNKVSQTEFKQKYVLERAIEK